ncbi:MAG TPA: hypothetical protein VHD55_03790 [Candidatus Paceibacterota bacterium]|nr:hypothetical protein [Candidatus Paceibacterota bacterium]
MQTNTPGQNSNSGQGGSASGQNQKPAGLSWSQPAAGAASTPSLMPTGGAANNQKSSAPMQQNKQSSPSASKNQPSDPASSKRMGMLAGAVVVVILLIVAWSLWGGSNNGATGTVATSTETGVNTDTNGTDMTGVPTMASGTGSLTVASPQNAGLTVAITSATVSAPTWVVVYESLNGAPGRALGATLFFPEQNGKAGTVSLLRATQPNQTYLVGESADTGNDRVFSLHGDKQVTGADGKVVWYTFKTR